MDKDAIREAAEMLEVAHDEFLEAYRMLEGDEGDSLNSPAIEKKFDRLDKCFWELMNCLNAAAHRISDSFSQ